MIETVDRETSETHSVAYTTGLYAMALLAAEMGADAMTPDALAADAVGTAASPRPLLQVGVLLANIAFLAASGAMSPEAFLAYGWQPQAMAVEGRTKAIRAGETEVFDVVADPGESRDLSGSAELSRALRKALKEYPAPALGPTPAADALGDEERHKLASLGYVAAAVPPAVREGAPRPAAMVHLFARLDQASTLFVRGEYARVAPLLEGILKDGPGNLDAALRLATARSALGQEARAEAAFERARRSAPRSPDVRAYLALHYARGRRWEEAVPLLEQVASWQFKRQLLHLDTR